MTIENISIDKEADTLGEDLREAQIKAREKLLRLIEEQGVKPFNFEAAKAKADFWPEDESIDDFIATIRKWRDEDRKGE